MGKTWGGFFFRRGDLPKPRCVNFMKNQKKRQDLRSITRLFLASNSQCFLGADDVWGEVHMPLPLAGSSAGSYPKQELSIVALLSIMMKLRKQNDPQP